MASPSESSSPTDRPCLSWSLTRKLEPGSSSDRDRDSDIIRVSDEERVRPSPQGTLGSRSRLYRPRCASSLRLFVTGHAGGHGRTRRGSREYNVTEDTERPGARPGVPADLFSLARNRTTVVPIPGQALEARRVVQPLLSPLPAPTGAGRRRPCASESTTGHSRSSV